jgi:hypothetical protein
VKYWVKNTMQGTGETMSTQTGESTAGLTPALSDETENGCTDINSSHYAGDATVGESIKLHEPGDTTDSLEKTDQDTQDFSTDSQLPSEVMTSSTIIADKAQTDVHMANDPESHAATPPGDLEATSADRAETEPAPSKWRVKLYRLAADGAWLDQGTGYASCERVESPGSHGGVALVVSNEEGSSSDEVLVQAAVRANDLFERQAESIIMWRDESQNVEYALSFQETEGCDCLWREISLAQREFASEHGIGTGSHAMQTTEWNQEVTRFSSTPARSLPFRSIPFRSVPPSLSPYFHYSPACATPTPTHTSTTPGLPLTACP